MKSVPASNGLSMRNCYVRTPYLISFYQYVTYGEFD